MSILGLLLLGALTATCGLAVAVAFARAVLYANVLTELDGTHELRRMGVRRRTARTSVPLPGRDSGASVRRGTVARGGRLGVTGGTTPV
jgi:hypothetical protein